MTIRQSIQTIRAAVEPLYGLREAESIARMVVCGKLDYNLSQLVAHYDEECEITDLTSVVNELQSGRPVQYVLGKAEFCEMEFEVAEGVLIPRPETEELVYRIAETTKRGARILDIGTGSGAIAIALAKFVKDAEVVAVDISPEALKIAEHNAERLGVKVGFMEADALGDLGALGTFDVIVSNPPYFVDSLLCPDSKRTTARHTTELTFEQLDDSVCRLLDRDKGRFALILPTEQMERYIAMTRLQLVCRCDVYSVVGGAAKRVMAEFAFESHAEPKIESITIERGQRGDYCPEYVALTKDFYLKF